MQALIDKIKNKKINMAVIGLGYVGLPLAVEFCKIILDTRKGTKNVKEGREKIHLL